MKNFGRDSRSNEGGGKNLAEEVLAKGVLVVETKEDLLVRAVGIEVLIIKIQIDLQ